jgi:hypothetical protein
MKARSAVLIIGGIVQVLVAALHIGIFSSIAAREIPGIAADDLAKIKVFMYLLNAAVLATVLFFAYVSLLRRRDLIATPLGRATAVFIVLFYVQRAVVEVIVSGFNPAPFTLLIAIAALYAFVALPVRQPPEELGSQR